LRLLANLLPNLPLEDTSIRAAACEPGVVHRPIDRPNLATVALEDHVGRVLACVEIVDLDDMSICGSKEMSAVTKPDLPALLNGDFLVRLDAGAKHVHHTQFVGKADNQMKA
jgi:hypothetical protein